MSIEMNLSRESLQNPSQRIRELKGEGSWVEGQLPPSFYNLAVKLKEGFSDLLAVFNVLKNNRRG